MTIAVLLTLLGALSRLLPHPPNAVALGAIALYAGARLPRGRAFVVPVLALALSDLVLDLGTGREAITPIRAAVYGCFLLTVLAGRLAASAAGPLRLAALAGGSAVFFFLATNFANWLQFDTYPRTLAGLALCYIAAIPWFWNTLLADLAGTAMLFGLDALSRRGAVRAVRTAAVLSLGLVFVSGHAIGQPAGPVPAPVSEAVVVTATAAPEEREDLGTAATVVLREDIERNGWRTVSDALRSVPGVDVLGSGGPGSQTSVFLRGSNSTHALVLVDGVRVNSPFFPGYDFALQSTENVDRIEIVRGPFSALYGSDALGGVIQIFTRPASGKLSGRVSAETGNARLREETAFATGGTGPWGVAASFRDHRSDGDRANDDWHERSGSVRLEGRFSDGLHVALEGAISDGELGLPGPVGAESPRDRYHPREERISLPATFHPAEGHTAAVVLGFASSRPSYDTPGFHSDTDARTLQGRVSDSFVAGAHTVTGFGGWERWTVDDASNFGSNLDGARATLWHVGAEDSVRLGAAIVTAGLRYDRHSQYGAAWSPRATMAWRAGGWKLRASAGTGFRAPSVGELYYPFSGNPALQPERSTSFDAGVESQAGSGRVELSLFWNDFRHLIVYDFSRFQNFNVGRARTRGLEIAWRQPLTSGLAADASYRYLDARDRETGLPLIRRARNSASVGLTIEPLPGLDLSPRAALVGPRADFDALTRERVRDPGYVRIDFFARYRAGLFAPYVRMENLADRAYAEVDGYPAPGRRWAGGLEVRF
ncbi:MAG: TonB-dependent receptor domain-containing protein [Thermoanaerobaculia bacterium]